MLRITLVPDPDNAGVGSLTPFGVFILEEMMFIVTQMSSAIAGLISSPVSLVVLLVLFFCLVLAARFSKIRFTPASSLMALAVAMAVIWTGDRVVSNATGRERHTRLHDTADTALPCLRTCRRSLGRFYLWHLESVLASTFASLQVLLDYPLPFMFIGLGSFQTRKFRSDLYFHSQAHSSCHFESSFSICTHRKG